MHSKMGYRSIGRGSREKTTTWKYKRLKKIKQEKRFVKIYGFIALNENVLKNKVSIFSRISYDVKIKY